MSDKNRRFTDKFALRLPDGLRDTLATKATENNRSTNAEIVARLEQSIAAESGLQTKLTVADRLDILERQVSEIFVLLSSDLSQSDKSASLTFLQKGKKLL